MVINYDLLTKENFKERGFLNKLNDKRVEALSRQDGKMYYQLCNRLGLEPEDVMLYGQGLTEVIR